jgi:hypothetical protein
MNCPACGRANPDGAKFCNQCAGPLPLRCLRCGTSNPAESRFCNGCAAPLTAGSTLSIRNNESEVQVNPEQSDSSSASDGERKTRSIRSYDRQLHSGLRLELLQYGQDPEVSALCPMALVYWQLGYPDRAVESVHRAKTLARALSHHIARPLHSASRAGFVYTAARRASMRKLRRQRYPFQPRFPLSQ